MRINMRVKEPKHAQLNVRLTDSLKREVEAASRELGLTMSDIVAICLEAVLCQGLVDIEIVEREVRLRGKEHKEK